jgi:fibronectin type 3 domain-containing protein
MTRKLAALTWAVSLVWMGACVNVDKPTFVVDCEKTGGCTDRVADAGAGLEALPPGNDVEARIDIGGGPFQDGPGTTDLPAVHDGPGTDASVFNADASAGPDRASDVPQDGIPVDVARDVSRDVASGACWKGGAAVAAGTVCREAQGLCDLAEVCDGVSADCPDDKFAPTATICREALGDCDVAESCSGSSPDCPNNTFLTAGTVCRKVAGLCDLAESCSGTDPNCPADSMTPAGTVCRESTDGNLCDPVETCTGSSVACPADVIYKRPATPTGVAGVAGILRATISWTPGAGGGTATGFNVKRSAVSGSGFTILGTPPTTTASPYLDTGLTGGVAYYYVVSSINTVVTCQSTDSTATTVTAGGSCTPPAVPSLTGASANGQVSLSWTASAGAVSYSIGRSLTAGTGYVSLTTTAGTNFVDINVSNGTNYFYVVTASNGSCSSGNSNEVPAAPSCTPPAPPTGLAAKANNGSVALTWTAPAGAVSYRILRSTTSGTGYALAGTSGIASFTDVNVVNGTPYYYVVTASNGVCSSGNSAEAPATPNCTPLSKPTGLTATAGDAQVVLAWAASTGGASSYQVFRSITAGGPYAQLSPSPTSPGFTDLAVVDGTTYYYVVRANGACPSDFSAEVSAQPKCAPPSIPTLSANPGDTKVTLSWTAATGNLASYTLTRRTSGADASTDIPNLTGTSYTDSPLTNGTTYLYVVSSSNGTCLSAASNQVSATPQKSCTLVAPTGVTATAGSKQVTLNWTAVSGAASYNISRSQTSGTGYASAGTATAPTVTFTDTASTLQNGTTYYYIVTASDSTCTSPNSTEVSAKPVCVAPTVPTGVTATANNSNGSISVSWGIPTGSPTGYTVSRSTSATGTFTAVSTNQTAVTYSDSTGLTAGTTYYYVVNASNAGGTCASVNSTPAVSAISCSSPSAPSGVKATAGIRRVTVSWTASTGSPTSYQIKRRTGTASFSVVGSATASPYVDSSATLGTTYDYVVAARNASGACSSADSAVASAAARDCAVVSGNAPASPASAGHPGKFLTTGPVCYVTCDTITNWSCYGTDYSSGRTITINGSQLTCGNGPIPAAKTTGFNVIDISAGTDTQDEIWWWGTYNDSACVIPNGGLDF